ncbi:rab-GTPase-TBC domain-containing protein [Flagelloscypha sp. PMI_526]|nr:rab-GTPase-TBC domain-containing protein [Flagelloscypha sp. PMI_526]
MDFEFVRPAQDGREGAGSVMSMRSSVSQGRPSFATSHHTTAPSSPSSSSPTSTINRPPSSMAAPPNTAQSVAAHRARELKWVQLLPTLNPATSMKGVYDGFKARRARNVGGDGEVGALLGAYLGMVPDIVYSIGLSQIVNQLLQLAPEEDAFWIFVSLMDLYLRPYFSSSITQLEVDASLFSKALEANDPQLAKKLLVELGIEPRMIVRGWWESLFVGVLPPEWAERVWDVFLFEGIPFLIRTTLACPHLLPAYSSHHPVQLSVVVDSPSYDTPRINEPTSTTPRHT